jgi:DNA repair protein SbcD/Mre11
MRILHTSDWHMNDRLGFQDRSEDICRALEQIANYLEEYKVDVMLVTGDLFERGNAEKKEIAIAEFKRIFQPFLTRGGTILAISGNHDDETFFSTLRDALDLVAPGRKGRDGTHATGRLYIAPKPRNLQLADEAGNVVQFVLMPYPTPRCYFRDAGLNCHTIEEKNRLIQNEFKNTLDELKSRLDARYPSVLLSHINIRGVKAHPLYRLSESDDVIFEPEHVPAYFAYAAYGHIHNPQEAIPGATHMRYAGSIERMDANESGDQKSVVFLEIADNRRVGKPELLPLKSTPIYHVEITDPDVQMSCLAEQHPDADHALVKYTLHWQPGRHNKDELCRALNGIFKRCYAREFVEVGRGNTGASGFAPQRMQDVIGTVNDYLKVQLAGHPQGKEIKALADDLLAQGGWR